MASENLAKLQATVNRYASRAEFSPLAIDGGMGPKTANAIVTALAWLAANVPAETDSASSLVIKIAPPPDSVPNQTLIMQTNVGLNTYLGDQADKLGLGAAASVALVQAQPPTSGLPAPNKSAFAVKPPPGAGFFDKTRLWFRQLPQWQQVGVGVASGLVVLAGITAVRKKKATGTAGYGKGR